MAQIDQAFRHIQRVCKWPSRTQDRPRQQMTPAVDGGAQVWPDSSVVERGPEKAGVGGSIPSLATTF